MDNPLLKWPDLVVMVLFFCVFIVIGVYFARKTKSSKGYFLADRNLPGWLVGVSFMATIVSCMTFLALPAVAYKENWRYMPFSVVYLLALIPAFLLFIPFYRRTGVQSAYEYLERRFGLWARLYAATLFVLWLVCRMAIILYAISLPVRTMVDIDIIWVIVILGLVATIYTVAGGLQAVIWNDLLSSIAMFIGAIVCLPILVWKLPGGFARIFTEGYADGKLSLGSTTFVFNEKTVWVMLLLSLFSYTHWLCQDQSYVQRYLAPKNDREARKALLVGAVLTVPVWCYFTFLGTALYVFYKVVPDARLEEVVNRPEQILPYFILTNIPMGLAGFTICGLIAAAMSTMDSSINAVASTLTTDFYRRLFVSGRDERHYLRFGRWISCLLGVLMILGAILIHYRSDEMLQDLQIVVQSISGGGLLALTLLGMLTVKFGNREAVIATGAGFMSVCAWLLLDSQLGRKYFPQAASVMPDKFWIQVLVNVSVFILGYLLAVLLRRKQGKDLTDLTIWTINEKD